MKFPATVERQAAVIVLIIVVGLFAAGGIGFLMSIRPCRLSLAPGAEVSYVLRTEILPEGGGEPLKVDEGSITLVCLSDDYEVALLAPRASDGRDELTRLKAGRDGTMRRIAADDRLLDDGKALGLGQMFDFNLLPLPQGLEQDWRLSVVYAALPEGQRTVMCRARRLKSGLCPWFELRPERTIEWAEEGPPRHYVQLKDFVCRYRYDARQGIVDSAEISFLLSRERDGTLECHRVRMTLSGQRRPGRGDALAQRDLALAMETAQRLLPEGRGSVPSAVLDRLRATPVGQGRLRDLARTLAADGEPPFERRAVPRPDPPSLDRVPKNGWVLQVASLSASGRAGAEALAAELRRDGYPGFVDGSGSWWRVFVGPYERVDTQVEQALARRFARNQPLWRRWP